LTYNHILIVYTDKKYTKKGGVTFVNMSQLKLPRWEKVEERWESERLATEKEREKERAAYLLRSMSKNNPPAEEECDLMLSGIRISRFVSDLECEKCTLATHDHTAGFLFTHWSDTWRQDIPIKFCLKDFYRKFPGVARAMSKYGR
jgi:hypothetical protein